MKARHRAAELSGEAWERPWHMQQPAWKEVINHVWAVLINEAEHEARAEAKKADKNAAKAAMRCDSIVPLHSHHFEYKIHHF